MDEFSTQTIYDLSINTNRDESLFEFLLLSRNKNYYMHWLNEDLIRLICGFYREELSQPQCNNEYKDISEDFDEFIKIFYDYSSCECYFDYYDNGYYYFHIEEEIDNSRNAFYFDEPRTKIDKICICIYHKNITFINYRISAKMFVVDIIRLIQEYIIKKEFWI